MKLEPIFFSFLLTVDLTSNRPFDYIVVHDLLPVPSETDLPNYFPYGWQSSGGLSEATHMCSSVHSTRMRRPQVADSFWWQAPPSGSGCVDFLWGIFPFFIYGSLVHYSCMKISLEILWDICGIPLLVSFLLIFMWLPHPSLPHKERTGCHFESDKGDFDISIIHF